MTVRTSQVLLLAPDAMQTLTLSLLRVFTVRPQPTNLWSIPVQPNESPRVTEYHVAQGAIPFLPSPAKGAGEQSPYPALIFSQHRPDPDDPSINGFGHSNGHTTWTAPSSITPPFGTASPMSAAPHAENNGNAGVPEDLQGQQQQEQQQPEQQPYDWREHQLPVEGPTKQQSPAVLYGASSDQGTEEPQSAASHTLERHAGEAVFQYQMTGTIADAQQQREQQAVPQTQHVIAPDVVHNAPLPLSMPAIDDYNAGEGTTQRLQSEVLGRTLETTAPMATPPTSTPPHAVSVPSHIAASTPVSSAPAAVLPLTVKEPGMPQPTAQAYGQESPQLQPHHGQHVTSEPDASTSAAGTGAPASLADAFARFVGDDEQQDMRTPGQHGPRTSDESRERQGPQQEPHSSQQSSQRRSRFAWLLGSAPPYQQNNRSGRLPEPSAPPAQPEPPPAEPAVISSQGQAIDRDDSTPAQPLSLMTSTEAATAGGDGATKPVVAPFAAVRSAENHPVASLAAKFSYGNYTTEQDDSASQGSVPFRELSLAQPVNEGTAETSKDAIQSSAGASIAAPVLPPAPLSKPAWFLNRRSANDSTSVASSRTDGGAAGTHEDPPEATTTNAMGGTENHPSSLLTGLTNGHASKQEVLDVYRPLVVPAQDAAHTTSSVTPTVDGGTLLPPPLGKPPRSPPVGLPSAQLSSVPAFLASVGMPQSSQRQEANMQGSVTIPPTGSIPSTFGAAALSSTSDYLGRYRAQAAGTGASNPADGYTFQAGPSFLESYLDNIFKPKDASDTQQQQPPSQEHTSQQDEDVSAAGGDGTSASQQTLHPQGEVPERSSEQHTDGELVSGVLQAEVWDGAGAQQQPQVHDLPGFGSSSIVLRPPSEHAASHAAG
jgi:hypothetical protein